MIGNLAGYEMLGLACLLYPNTIVTTIDVSSFFQGIKVD